MEGGGGRARRCYQGASARSFACEGGNLGESKPPISKSDFSYDFARFILEMLKIWKFSQISRKWSLKSRFLRGRPPEFARPCSSVGGTLSIGWITVDKYFPENGFGYYYHKTCFFNVIRSFWLAKSYLTFVGLKCDFESQKIQTKFQRCIFRDTYAHPKGKKHHGIFPEYFPPYHIVFRYLPQIHEQSKCAE